MEERPKIRLELTGIDKIIELFGWFFVLVLWVYTMVNFSKLPDTIPTHFNAMGEADDFGEKASILALPIIATIVFVGISILSRFPHIFNYPVNITKENAQRQYKIATRLMRYVNLIVVLIIGYITFTSIQSAKGQTGGLGAWFLPVSLGVVFIPIIYYIVVSRKKSNH